MSLNDALLEELLDDVFTDAVKTRQLARLVRGLSPTLLDWCRRVFPTWNWSWPHLLYVATYLERVLAGEIKRLIIELPVRHGKSELVSTRFPVYALHDDPSRKLILGSYNDTLARKFSRRAREIANRTGLETNDDRQAAHDWETAEGGGMRSAGVGTGVTGHGGDGIIIDDPIKSREEAESETIREKVWEWYTNDLYSRLEPNAWMIVMAARWHSDDLIGRILESEDKDNWTICRLPALAEKGDPLGRAEGEALCRERYDEATLAAIRLVMGEYAFAGLYQQRPTPRDGNMFPRDKVEIVDAAPANARRVRYWDKAGTEGDGKFTAGVRMSYVPLGEPGGGIFYVEDVVRGQWASEKRNAIMKQTAQLELGVKQKVEQEPGSGGKESAEFTIKLMAGSAVDADRVTGDKTTRADPMSSQWRAGNVKLVRGDWNKPYLDEMEKAPNGKYLDQMDASSGAFNELALGINPNIRSLT